MEDDGYSISKVVNSTEIVPRKKGGEEEKKSRKQYKEHPVTINLLKPIPEGGKGLENVAAEDSMRETQGSSVCLFESLRKHLLLGCRDSLLEWLKRIKPHSSENFQTQAQTLYTDILDVLGPDVNLTDSEENVLTIIKNQLLEFHQTAPSYVHKRHVKDLIYDALYEIELEVRSVISLYKNCLDINGELFIYFFCIKFFIEYRIMIQEVTPKKIKQFAERAETLLDSLKQEMKLENVTENKKDLILKRINKELFALYKEAFEMDESELKKILHTAFDMMQETMMPTPAEEESDTCLKLDDPNKISTESDDKKIEVDVSPTEKEIEILNEKNDDKAATNQMKDSNLHKEVGDVKENEGCLNKTRESDNARSIDKSENHEIIAENDEANIEDDKPSVKKDEPSIKKDEPSIKKDEPSTKNDETSTKNDDPSIKSDKLTVGNDESSVESDESSVESDESSVESDESSVERDEASVENNEESVENNEESVESETLNTKKASCNSVLKEEEIQRFNENIDKLKSPSTVARPGRYESEVCDEERDVRLLLKNEAILVKKLKQKQIPSQEELNSYVTLVAKHSAKWRNIYRPQPPVKKRKDFLEILYSGYTSRDVWIFAIIIALQVIFVATILSYFGTFYSPEATRQRKSAYLSQNYVFTESYSLGVRLKDLEFRILNCLSHQGLQFSQNSLIVCHTTKGRLYSDLKTYMEQEDLMSYFKSVQENYSKDKSIDLSSMSYIGINYVNVELLITQMEYLKFLPEVVTQTKPKTTDSDETDSLKSWTGDVSRLLKKAIHDFDKFNAIDSEASLVSSLDGVELDSDSALNIEKMALVLGDMAENWFTSKHNEHNSVNAQAIRDIKGMIYASVRFVSDCYNYVTQMSYGTFRLLYVIVLIIWLFSENERRVSSVLKIAGYCITGYAFSIFLILAYHTFFIH